MQLARLPVGELEPVVAEMIDHPEKAKTQLANLA